MKIAFNPSTVAALITPPNNKDITFDLRGRNIFARGVKFCGTDTWRDIKINNVSIGSNILDLRNGSNTTLTNTNGVVTINSTWRPVVDNLTSDSTTSSLSAKQGKILKSLIDGKSNSGHTHDDRYLRLTGGTMAGNALITFADSGSWGTDKGPQGARGGLYWTGQSDYAKLYAEETVGDNLDLVIQFGDDNSNGLSIRNKANTQTSYISAGGVITTGTFKGNLDWSYITNKPSSYTPSAHTHAWNSLTHSSTIENQAILTNGKANGWKLYTLNISRWDNAANNAHSHANKSVLDGITSALVNNWNVAYTFVNTISGTDTDKVINKWDEIVNFLAGITEDNKLNTLLNSKLSIQQLSTKDILTTKTNNALFWVNTIGTASSITTGPFTDHPYALLSVTNYNQNTENSKFFYRSRLAFSSTGDIKVASCHHENVYKQDETWYNVLTSKNSGISGSTIKLNGTSITVYSSSTADGRYVKKTGDTMSGVLTIDTTNFGALTIKRNDDANGASIQFRGKSSVYGYIGLNNSTKDKQFLRWNSDTSKTYTILDTSSTYTSNGKGVINGTTITQVDNATNSTNSTNARKLVNWYSTRPTSLNAQFGDGSLRIFYATSSTTEGKPAEDSHILHLAWDNNGGWDAQLAVHTRSGKVSTRAQNSGTWQPWKTLAFTTDIPSSLKNPYSLNVFGVTYDGSAAKVVSPSNFISQVNEATSTVTDGTMLITSWASNSGFADTNAVNIPYKRKAIHLWEYIKAKTDSLYATRGHNHDDRYLKLTGGTMSGTIYRNSGGTTISGRDHAIIRQTHAPGGSSWNPIACVDTETGTWTLGHLSSGSNNTDFNFCFSTNADYNAGNNNGNYVTLRNKVGTIALLSDIPSSLKNPHALTISLNGTSQGPYDGSTAKNINITPSSIGAATSGHNHDDRYYTKAESNAKYITDITTSVNKLTFTKNGSNIDKDIKVNVVYSQGNLTNISDKNATTKASSGLFIYNSYNQVIGTNSYSSVLSINTGGTIQIAGNWGDDQSRNLYWRSQSDRAVSSYPWKSWRTILDSENYSSTLDSRYYTESEVNNLLDAKLNRQNLSYGTWNPRDYNLAADYSYNGGDLSISESGGKIHISVDGYFWQNEGQYRVLDTSDISSIRGGLTLYQHLSATDATRYPIVWGGSDHKNTNNSTGSLYKSYDKLSWQTSSQTLYATNIQTENIKHLSIGGGIYWNPYVESASDGSDSASITLVRQGVAGGTTLVLSQMNDANDTIQFKTNGSARLYHNSYPILTTQNTYVSNNKGYINGTEITQVNNADKVDNRHAISTTPNTGIIYKAAIYTSSSLTSYWVRLASIPSISQNSEFIATIHVQSGHSNPGRSAILLVYLRGSASSFTSKSFKIYCNSNYDPNRFRLYYKDSDKTSEIWYQTTGQWDGIITTVISQSSEGSLYEGLTLYSGSITAVQTPSMSTYLSAQVSTITDNILGNAATATKLQTARSIWGHSFNGTADINGTIYINNNNSSEGAIRLNNNINSNARISAIDSQVIFNTDAAIRFGGTSWDWNVWAGLKYTHSNKTIYLGIADGSVFNANSAQSGGSLRFPGISNVYATTFNGSLSGNASTATTLQTTRTLWGQSFNGSNNVSGNMSGVGQILFSNLSGTNGRALLYQQMADNDFFRIYVGGTASNSGYVEIATADDGNEPIYVRQYTGAFSSVKRTLTLLDGSGNTIFPGSLSIGGNIIFPNSSHLLWNSGSWYQRILLNDDSTADTSVFTFQQSSDSGTNWSNLMTIRDNGKVIANTFVGTLLGNASSATNTQNIRIDQYASTGEYPIIWADSASSNANSNTISRLYKTWKYLYWTPNKKTLTLAGNGTKCAIGSAFDTNDRPGLHITGNYPELIMMSQNVSNANHGSTIVLGAYTSNSDSETNYRAFAIGMNGPTTNEAFLDFGYGMNQANPHANGIANYGGGSFNNPYIMRLTASKRVFIQGIGDDQKPALQVNASRNGTWVYTASFLAPNLTSNHNNAIFIGKAHSACNAFGLTHMHIGDSSVNNYAALEVWGVGNVQRWYYDRHSSFLHRADFSSLGSDASYMNSALQIREHGYNGTQADTWANAPRMSWHWSGRVQTQIGLSSNNELYLSKNNFGNAYRLVYETGTWGINISGNASSAGNADTVDGEHASAFTRIVGRNSISTTGTAPYNYIYLFRIANSNSYSTLDCEIDFRTRYHSAKIEIRIATNNPQYGVGNSSISIVKKVINGRSCNFWVLQTVQSSNYNYYDVYYESGAWNSGSYGIIFKGSNGVLVFEHKGINLTSLPDKVIPVSNNVATSATKLQTPRTIWGQSFDGTGNVDNTLRIRQTTGNWCEGIRIQTADSTWATIILGATGDSGTNANAWSIHRKSDNNFAISRNSSDGTNGLVMTSVGMGLGTTAPTQRLDVHGNIRATGNSYATHFYESSDKTLKKNIKSILSSTNIPKIREFDWKDTEEHSYGFIAQELEEQGYGCLVSEANGKKTVNYTATLALTVAKLQNLINIQNKKISNLTKELKALKYGRKKNS